MCRHRFQPQRRRAAMTKGPELRLRRISSLNLGKRGLQAIAGLRNSSPKIEQLGRIRGRASWLRRGIGCGLEPPVEFNLGAQQLVGILVDAAGMTPADEVVPIRALSPSL